MNQSVTIGPSQLSLLFESCPTSEQGNYVVLTRHQSIKAWSRVNHYKNFLQMKKDVGIASKKGEEQGRDERNGVDRRSEQHIGMRKTVGIEQSLYQQLQIVYLVLHKLSHSI